MRTHPLSRVRLVATDSLSIPLDLLTREHPSALVQRSDACGACDPIVDVDAWRRSRDFRVWDEAVERSESDAITVRGAGRDVVRTACEVLTRYQRLISRRNPASKSPLFDAVLRAHACLHDCHKPLVRADFDHALDTWQWMLRLDAEAGLAVQLAALFHDIERLESEADRRVEHHAADYQAFKDAHARKGAQRAYEVLVKAGVDDSTALCVERLVAVHEKRASEPEVDLLNDADALSFFSLNSPGYIAYFGPEQTRKKVAYTLGRMGPAARERLANVRLIPEIHDLVFAAEAA